MAVQSTPVTLRAKWLRGWELMRDGKTSEGYDLLSGIKLNDLDGVSDCKHPERALKRVKSIIERQPRAEASGDRSVMDILVCAAKRGDQEASDLLVFGDLEEFGTAQPDESEKGRWSGSAAKSRGEPSRESSAGSGRAGG